MRREERGESEDEVFLPGEMETEIVAAGPARVVPFYCSNILWTSAASGCWRQLPIAILQPLSSFSLSSLSLRTAIDAGAGLDYACRHLLQEIPE